MVRKGLLRWFPSSDVLCRQPDGSGEIHRGDSEPKDYPYMRELVHPARLLEAVGDGRDHRHFTSEELKELRLNVRETNEAEYQASDC